MEDLESMGRMDGGYGMLMDEVEGCRVVSQMLIPGLQW